MNKYGKGESLESRAVQAVDPFLVPGPPGTPDVADVKRGGCTLIWTRPECDGGAPVEGEYICSRICYCNEIYCLLSASDIIY